jgi:hypothetical protein
MEDPAHGGEEHAVERLELRPARLAFQHAHLMSEHQDLQVLRVAVPSMASQQSSERPDHEGKEEEHRGMVEEPPLEGAPGFLTPTGIAQGARSQGRAWPRRPASEARSFGVCRRTPTIESGR